jgi:hypothetical protein
MRANRTEQYNPGLVEFISRKLLRGHKQPDGNVQTAAQDIYEVRPRKDGDGFDLIGNQLRFGPIWYMGPSAIGHAIAYAKYRSSSRSHRAFIRVFNEEGNVTQTHELNVS